MRRAIALALLLSALATLGGCGSDGDDSPASAISTQGNGEDAVSSQGSRSSSSRGAGQSVDRARKRNAYERKRYGEPSQRSEPFAKYSGPASEGKLHLAEFGAEAEAHERKEAGAVVSEYLGAVATERWTAACDLLADEELEQLQEAPGPADGSCGHRLPSAFAASGGLMPTPGRSDIASLRIVVGGRAGEGTGFALFHDEGSDFWITVKREDDHQWKVLSAAPQSFG